MWTQGDGKLTKQEWGNPGIFFAPELEIADLALKSFLVAFVFTFEKQDK